MIYWLRKNYKCVIALFIPNGADFFEPKTFFRSNIILLDEYSITQTHMISNLTFAGKFFLWYAFQNRYKTTSKSRQKCDVKYLKWKMHTKPKVVDLMGMVRNFVNKIADLESTHLTHEKFRKFQNVNSSSRILGRNSIVDASKKNPDTHIGQVRHCVKQTHSLYWNVHESILFPDFAYFSSFQRK